MKAKKSKTKRKVAKGTFDTEVDGNIVTVRGKRVEKRGGRVTKFKAKGEGEGFRMKINDKKKVDKRGLVKKVRKQTKYK